MPDEIKENDDVIDDNTDDVDSDIDKFFDSLDKDDEPEKTIDDKDSKLKTDSDVKEKDDDPSKNLSLEERLSLLEKENKGLKRDIVKVRNDRRDAREKYDGLNKIIEEVISKRGSQDQDKAGEKEEDALKNLKLPIEYDENGHPFVPAAALAEVIKGQDKKIDSAKEELAREKAEKQAMAHLQKEINTVLHKDELFPSLYQVVTGYVDELNNKVKEIQQANNDIRLIQPSEALDLLEEEGYLEEWQEAHPNVDPDIIVNAFDSKRALNKALTHLKNVSAKSDNDGTKGVKTIDKVSKKAALPGKSSTDSKESIVQRVGKYTASDILELDDKSVELLMKRMKNEEMASIK